MKARAQYPPSTEGLHSPRVTVEASLDAARVGAGALVAVDARSSAFDGERPGERQHIIVGLLAAEVAEVCHVGIVEGIRVACDKHGSPGPCGPGLRLCRFRQIVLDPAPRGGRSDRSGEMKACPQGRLLSATSHPLRAQQLVRTALGSRLLEALAILCARQVFVHSVHQSAPDISVRVHRLIDLLVRLLLVVSGLSVTRLPRSCAAAHEGAYAG